MDNEIVKSALNTIRRFRSWYSAELSIPVSTPFGDTAMRIGLADIMPDEIYEQADYILKMLVIPRYDQSRQLGVSINGSGVMRIPYRSSQEFWIYEKDPSLVFFNSNPALAAHFSLGFWYLSILPSTEN